MINSYVKVGQNPRSQLQTPLSRCKNCSMEVWRGWGAFTSQVKGQARAGCHGIQYNPSTLGRLRQEDFEFQPSLCNLGTGTKQNTLKSWENISGYRPWVQSPGMCTHTHKALAGILTLPGLFLLQVQTVQATHYPMGRDFILGGASPFPFQGLPEPGPISSIGLEGSLGQSLSDQELPRVGPGSHSTDPCCVPALPL